MRRQALLATTLIFSGLLSGCAGSGAYAYLGDTTRVPFHSNPNVAPGSGETYAKVRAQAVPPPAPMLYEAGDIWPPPPKAPPTLKQLQAEQNQELIQTGDGAGNYAPLQPLPQLPGYEVPDQMAHQGAPTRSFPRGNVPLPQGGGGITTGGGTVVRPGGNGSIVVPNGNGTSTVIGPNGSVSTIPTPGK